MLVYGKLRAHAVTVGAHLSSHWPLSLSWKLIHYPGTQGHCDIQVSTLPSLGFSRYPFINQPIWEDE